MKACFIPKHRFIQMIESEKTLSLIPVEGVGNANSWMSNVQGLVMLRWIAPFGAAILIIGWNRELEDFQVALSFSAALLVAMLLQVAAPKNKDLE